MLNYEYVETENRDVMPQGEGWEYWSDRIVKDESGNIIEQVAVYRRVLQ